MALEKRLEKKDAMIDRIARKLIKFVRKKELERLRKKDN